MGAIFRACRTPAARAAIRLVPNRLIGAVFSRARVGWKGLTSTTKRHGLGDATFAVDPPGGSASADWHALGRDPVAPLFDGSDAGEGASEPPSGEPP